jgi:hypothetical protein
MLDPYWVIRSFHLALYKISKLNRLRFDRNERILARSPSRHRMNSTFSSWTRRSFLKAGIAASALPEFPLSLAEQASIVHASRKHLPPIPTVNDLAGSRLVHAWRDLYQSPTTQNEYGYVQAAKSVCGLTALSLPPFACCGGPDMAWSPGFLLTCELFLDGQLLLSITPGGDTIAYQWFPHKFVRESRVKELQFTTDTFMPSRRRAAAQSIRIKNLSNASRTFTLGFDMRAAVSKKTTMWFVNSPGEADNKTGMRVVALSSLRLSIARRFPSKGFLPKRAESKLVG